MEGGYIKLSRAFDNWRWHGNGSATVLWIDILLHSNWQDGWGAGGKYRVKRGEMLTSLEKLAISANMSRNTVKKYLTLFVEEKQIQIRNLGHDGFIVRVVNYEKYQGEDPVGDMFKSEHFSEHQRDQQTERIADPDYQYKRNKRNKEIKNTPTPAEISDYIREINGKTDPDRFFEYYQARGWKNITDWKAAVRSWEAGEKDKRRKAPAGKKVHELPEYMKDTWDD